MSPTEPTRQTMVVLPGASSGGQPCPGTPVQSSFWSQTSPEPGRQTLPMLIGASSAGQAALEPVQVSLRSHGAPAPGRQIWPLARNVQVAVQQELGATVGAAEIALLGAVD